MKVIIVGGGIGGLSTAIGLSRKGFSVQVLEKAPQLTEIGAGIQIGCNGTWVLKEFGLEEKIAQACIAPAAWDFRDLYTGKLLYSAPINEPDGSPHWGSRLYNIHRADLIDILAEALPTGTVKLNSECTGFSQDANGVEVYLKNGETVRGDVLVGADGIKSAIRRQLKGEEETRFADILMWRSLIPAEKLRDVYLPERGNYWTGPGRTLITYWLRPKNLYSILASVPASEIHKESWTESGDIEELKKSFQNIEPRAQKMMDQIETSFITGMYFRDPIDGWTNGRVTLLGDAAHPMTPYYAQGGSQSLEDAYVFSEMMARKAADNLEDALMEYEARRRPRTVRLQSGSRRMVKMTHESEPQRIAARNGRWKGQRRIDPYLESDFRMAWGYNVVTSLDRPASEELGLSGTREGLKMQRPESQRAYELWKNAFSPEDFAEGYDGFRKGYERLLKTNFPLPKGIPVAKKELFDVSALSVSAAGCDEKTPHFTILHFHGGGYLLGSADSSLEYAHRLAENLNGECITVDYRLGPEHPYPAALDDATTAYRSLLNSGVPASSILLSGESSGGGLAIALALVIKMAGDAMPAGIISVCPYADLTVSGPTVAEFAETDAAANPDVLRLMAESYFQGHEPRDPLVSPVFADLSGLPPIFLTAAANEVLLSDTTRLAESASSAGTSVKLRIVEDSVHVYPLFPFLPETREVMAEIKEWANDLKSF